MGLNPIEIAYSPGYTLYAILHNPNGTVWNNISGAFESYSQSDWADYAVAMTEQAGSGYYSAVPPSGIGDVLTTECIYRQVGGSPSLSDASGGPLGIGQAQGVDVASVVHSPTAASNMNVNLLLLVQGTAQSGTLSTTQMTTNLAASLASVYAGRLVAFTSGALYGQAATISAYNPTGGLLTFSAVAQAPTSGTTFLII